MDIIVTLPILYETEEYRDAKELGLQFKGQKYTSRQVTFYSIDIVAPNYDFHDTKVHTSIITGGVEMIFPMTPDDVETQINDSIFSTFGPNP